MKKPHLKKVGHVGDNEVYSFTPVGISKRSAADLSSANAEYSENSSTVFDGDGVIQPKTFTRGDHEYKYIPYGPDDRLPYHLIRLVGDNMVMAQNKLFNVLTCYGGGLRFRPVDGQTAVPDALTEFAFRNNLDRFFIEQAMDMKYFFFTVTCIILDRDGKNIVQIRHKESCYCRFEQADDHGRINHVFYANWLKGSVTGDDVEIIPLLDYNDPYGDLRVRLGFDPDPATGECRRPLKTDPAGRPTRDRKFAILTRFPTPGFQYYPVPFYTSIFRDSWYDIYELIGKGKRAKIRNSAPPRFQIEVHKDYWDNLCDQEGITDPVKRKARIALEKRNIEQFITGSANIGKTWITGYYVDPASGKEVRMRRHSGSQQLHLLRRQRPPQPRRGYARQVVYEQLGLRQARALQPQAALRNGVPRHPSSAHPHHPLVQRLAPPRRRRRAHPHDDHPRQEHRGQRGLSQKGMKPHRCQLSTLHSTL